MGELNPLRSIGDFQRIFLPDAKFHAVGTFLALLMPSELFPRNPLEVTFDISIESVAAVAAVVSGRESVVGIVCGSSEEFKEFEAFKESEEIEGIDSVAAIFSLPVFFK